MSSLECIEELNWPQKVWHIVISPSNLNSSSFGSLISTLFHVVFEEWIDKDENSLSSCFGEYKHESIFTWISWNLSLRSKIWSRRLSVVKPLTIITKLSTLDVAAVLDPPLRLQIFFTAFDFGWLKYVKKYG